MKQEKSKYIIFTAILACMLWILPGNHVYAAQMAAKVITADNVETTYESLSDAVAAMTDGATLYLQEDSSERIDVPDGEHWKIRTGDYTYSGWIWMGDESEIELVDGHYASGFFIQNSLSTYKNYVVLDDNLTMDRDARDILERFEKPDQWCREYEDGQYVLETTTKLPYKVNGQLYASSARATYGVEDGSTLYIVEDTDRGISRINTWNLSMDIDAGDCTVKGEIELPKNCNIISGSFDGATSVSDEGVYTITEKCRFTSRGFVVSCCSENEIVVHDSDWYYRKVSVDDSKKNVIANGKTYVDIDHALKDINRNENIVFNLTDDYPEVISLSYGYHVKLDFGKYSFKSYLENFADLEIASGRFDGGDEENAVYIGTTQQITISGGYFGYVDFDEWSWGNGNPGYTVKGGTFSPYAYEYIKDDIADGYQAVYKNGNYVVQKQQTKVTGWQASDGKWYYYDADGVKTTGWQKVDGTWYYMDKDGVMTTGWQAIGGAWYYMNGSGAMTTGWQAIGGTWYYMNESGAMTTGWQIIGGAWYYMNGSGAMTTGWQIIGGAWYYMNGSGVMTTGWQAIGGAWYYMNGSGVMVTGWQAIGGAWYYMNGSGVMVTGWQVIDGRWYRFNASGVWIG